MHACFWFLGLEDWAIRTFQEPYFAQTLTCVVPSCPNDRLVVVLHDQHQVELFQGDR